MRLQVDGEIIDVSIIKVKVGLIAKGERVAQGKVVLLRARQEKIYVERRSYGDDGKEQGERDKKWH